MQRESNEVNTPLCVCFFSFNFFFLVAFFFFFSSFLFLFVLKERRLFVCVLVFLFFSFSLPSLTLFHALFSHSQRMPSKQKFLNDTCKYAEKGDLKKLRKAVDKDPKSVHTFDERLSLSLSSLICTPRARTSQCGCTTVGYTPLHYAAASGNGECVELLIMHGAKVNGTVRYGEITALHAALLAKKEATALILLKHGANPEAVYHNQSCTTLATTLGKRFEMEFNDTARKNRPAAAAPAPAATVIQAPISAPAATTAAPVVPSPVVPVPVVPAPRAPAAAAPLSPADAAQQAMAMLGLGAPDAGMPGAGGSGDDDEGEKQTLRYNKLMSSPAMQSKLAERRALLERRMRKCETIMRTLSVWRDPGDLSAPDVRAAVAGLGFDVEPLPEPAPQPQPAEAPAPAPQPQPQPQPQAPAATPTAAAPVRQVSDTEAAEAIVQHFKSWFDASVPPVVLPAWQGAPVAPAAAAAPEAAGGGVPAAATAAQGTGVKLVPMEDMLLQWTQHVSGMGVVSHDFDFGKLKGRDVREYIDGFRDLQTVFAAQVDLQQAALGDAYKDAKANVGYLHERVCGLLDQYRTVTLGQMDPAYMVMAFMQMVGATYYTFQALFDVDAARVIPATRQFVESLLGVVKVANSERQVVADYLRLGGVVNALLFRCQSPELSKEISYHLSTVMLTARALVMDTKQGRPPKKEYNASIGAHLSKLKELVRSAARAHRGERLPSKDEAHVADMATGLLTQLLASYTAALTDGPGRALVQGLEPVVPLVSAFAAQCARARDRTLYTWVEVLQAAQALAAGVARFCDQTLAPLDDPDGFYRAAIPVAKQYAVEILIGVTALSVENPVCPRHHIVFALRALAIHLAGILDVCYLSM